MKTEIEKFVTEINEVRKEFYTTSFPNLKPAKIALSNRGRKYAKLVYLNEAGKVASVWGFIALNNGNGYRKGDLLKPASFSAPAKHARGNILNGTAKWTVNGPAYLR